MSEPTLTVSRPDWIEVGETIGLHTTYTPKWLLWRRHRRVAYRIELTIRWVCKRFGYEIWPMRCQTFVVTEKCSADSTISISENPISKNSAKS
jgi:hypothetical protein